ncbi:sugar phosphate isomerase/epimerase family protein [Paenibacillus sp. NRS-1760]|uniref:sugar phosphate isomerase/epimerase family protein n=1 Tax=Paenibacillus sp. NRS-1760 TaxID=3233902 RepID=UPI003D267EFD
MMKKGINMWCFPEEFRVDYCMKVAKEAGFDGIELNMEEETKDSSDLRLTLASKEKDILDIKEMSKIYELEMPSISTALCWKSMLCSDNSTTREEGKTVVKKMIDAAVILGADTVLVVPGRVDEQISYIDCYNRSLQSLKELVPYAESNKVNIGIENVWNKFLMSPIEMRRFIEEIGSPNVKAYFDVGNVVQFSYPEYWIDILDDLITKVHVKDFKRDTGNITGFTNLLEGDTRWDFVINSLEKVNYDSYLTAELSPYKLNPNALIKQTSMAMDFILGKDTFE